MMLRSSLALLSLVVVGAAAAPPSPNALRHLEQNGYQYIEDFSGYWTTYISCFKVKIQDDNDDDAEGNSYFYNGKYHAQYQTYAAFHLCSNNECDADSCDKATGYVTDLADYLETKVEFAQDYCNACQNQCRRRLEEEEEEEDDNGGDAVADCNTCKNECSGLWNPGNNYDEANYLDCQQGQDGGDFQYYQAPTCDDGKLVMGLFYDEDCTVASKADLEVAFNYDTFAAVENMCTSCDGNDDVCADLYQDASHCFGTSEMQGDGGNQVCKKYEQAVREVTYARRKRKYHIRGAVIAVAVLLVVGIFLTHAYFIRHRNKDVNEKSIPLSKFDHGASVHEPQTSNPQVTMT